jgi:hypothetical protein
MPEGFAEMCIFVHIFLNIWIWASHSGGYEEFSLPGYNAVDSGDSQTDVSEHVALLAASFMLVYCLEPEYGSRAPPKRQ